MGPGGRCGISRGDEVMQTRFHNGLRLAKYREFNGLSQEALAGRLGVDVRTIRRWETKGVPEKQVLYVAETLGLKIEALWDRNISEEQFHHILGQWTSGGKSSGHGEEPGSYSIPSIRIPQRKWADWMPPGALLRAEYGVTPFHGRESEIKNLFNWVHGDHPVSLRLYTGPGGMGKTRLALEICTRLKAKGWTSGFISRDAPFLRENWAALFGKSVSVFIVIDYAETHGDLLARLIGAIPDNVQTKIRILLLARAAGDWWEKLKTVDQNVGDLLCGSAAQWISLEPLALTSGERRRSFTIAMENFAPLLNKPTPKTNFPDFEDACYERILLVHMRALATLDGARVKGEHGILDYILKRERRYWRKMAKDRGLGATLDIGIGRGMAAITLGGGAASEAETFAILQSLEFFHDQPRDILTAISRLLRNCYPGEKWIEPLQPDLLGEQLVEYELDQGADELLELTLGVQGKEFAYNKL